MSDRRGVAGLASRLLGGAPLLVVAALFLAVTRWPVAGGLALALVLLGMALGPRLPLQILGHVMLAALASLVVFVLLSGLAPARSGGLAPIWAGPALWALLLGAARLFTSKPPGGTLGTWALGLLCLAVCGQTRIGAPYGVAVLLYLMSALALLRSEDEGALGFGAQGLRGKAVGLLLPVAGAGLGWVVIQPLPAIHEWVQRKFDETYGGEIGRGAFTERLRLGGLSSMLDSDRLVLRVSGGGTDYLRGAVYNQYKKSRWLAPTTVPVRVRTALDRPRPQSRQGAEVTEVQNLGTDGERLFLPLDVEAIGTARGYVNADTMGALGSADEGGWSRVWWVQGDRGRRVAPPAAPGPDDLTLPADLRPDLERISRAWLGEERDALRVLQRLERKLSHDYAYALRFQRTPGRDPVLDFLEEHRQGHCEYFATAMVLLARAAGVPARLVGGYRVTERNPVGGYFLVRDNNAHAWVEAYLPGPGMLRGWRTFDPTPFGQTPQNRPHETPLLGGVWDLLSVGGSRLWQGLRERAWEASLTMSALLGGLLAARRWRAGRGRARREAGGAGPGLGVPLQGYLLLAAALARGGERREAWETLEGYAGRVRDAEAAALLLRYAALRYGGAEVEDQAALENELAACAARLGSAHAGGAAD